MALNTSKCNHLTPLSIKASMLIRRQLYHVTENWRYLAIVDQVLDASDEPCGWQASWIAGWRWDATTELNGHWRQQVHHSRHGSLEVTTTTIFDGLVNRLVKKRQTAVVNHHTNVLSNNIHTSFSIITVVNVKKRKDLQKRKVDSYSIRSVRLGADPSIMEVSPLVALVINPVVGWNYFKIILFHM